MAMTSQRITLAHVLGERVIAEGVQTVGHLGRLRELGCDLAQDRHSPEPLPSEDAAALNSKALENGIRWVRGRPGPSQREEHSRYHHQPPPSL